MYSFHIILVSYITEVGDHFSKVAIVTVIAVLPRYTAIDSYIGGTIDHPSSFLSSSFQLVRIYCILLELHTGNKVYPVNVNL